MNIILIVVILALVAYLVSMHHKLKCKHNWSKWTKGHVEEAVGNLYYDSKGYPHNTMVKHQKRCLKCGKIEEKFEFMGDE
jgi:high-affinity Fe2+/Pb2+ permease